MTRLPAYDPYQSSFHDAFRPELYAILDSLPVPRDARVIDVPCGNGFYSRRLADRLGVGSQLHAVDACDGYLARAREVLADAGARIDIEVRRADAYHLPYPDATFDLVWCAQSLISLDVLPALREMYRLVKPNGVVAVLEVDEFHHVLLPWPVELEVALPEAIRKASAERYGDALRLSPARRLRSVLQRCGFRSVRRLTHTLERAAPFDQMTTEFLARHCEFLRALVYPQLSERLQHTFDRLTDPDSEASLFRLPESEFICLAAVYLARPASAKPRTAPPAARCSARP